MPCGVCDDGWYTAFMKKTTCRDLRGACDEEIFGETPEAMAQNCKKHVMDMLEAGDDAHRKAVESMQQLSSQEQAKWHEGFKERFASLPEA